MTRGAACANDLRQWSDPDIRAPSGSHHERRIRGFGRIMTQASDDHGLIGLSPAEARLGRAFGRSQAIAIACIVVLALLGWLSLALMIAGIAGSGQLGALASR